MANELAPSVAADLAFNVYAVNGNDEVALKTFMKARIFEQGGGQTLLKGAVGGRVLRAATDSFALCALGAGPYKGDLFLIFRGTTEANNKADFITDARIGLGRSKAGLPVHIGFNHTFNSMLPDIRTFLTEAKITGSVHCIGHSLGGAVASLAADWVSRSTPYSAKLYTFGAPRVGTEWFANSTTNSIRDSNMHRVYHKTDPVPMVALYPFMHAPYGQIGHYLHSADPLTSGAAHSMAKYVDSVKGTAWSQLSAQPEPYDIEIAIESWLKSKSPVNSASASFWHKLEAALIYVLKKVAMNALLSLQDGLMGILSFADKIAYILAKGIDLSENVSIWVEHLMRKLMQALGMKVAASKKELTRELIRRVLIRITQKASENARKALRDI